MSMGMFIFLLVLFGVLFVAYWVVLVLGLSGKFKDSKANNVSLYLFIIIPAAMTAIIAVLYYLGGATFEDAQIFGRILWFCCMLCIMCNAFVFWFTAFDMIDFNDSIDFFKDIKNDYKAIFRLISFYIIAIVPTPIVAFIIFKILPTVEISAMLLHMLNKPIQGKAVTLGILGWIVIIASLLWNAFLMCILIDSKIIDYRTKKIYSFCSDADSVQSLSHLTYEYSRKHRLDKNALETILYQTKGFSIDKAAILKRFDDYNVKKSYKAMSEEALSNILFSDYLDKSSDSDRISELRAKETLYQLNMEIEAKRLEIAELKRLSWSVFPPTLPLTVSENEEPTQEKNNLNPADMVRDIYHLTQTPLMSISGAVKNLYLENENEATRREARGIINRQTELIGIIMSGYRSLAMNVPDFGKTVDIGHYLRSAVESASAVENKTVSLTMDEFPEKICDQGNIYAVLILKPLVDNAVEASPDGGTVAVKVTENEDEYIVSVENKCVTVPVQSDLDKQGYTTKENGGEGLTSVRRLAGKNNYKFQIRSIIEEKTVIADIRFPKA